MSQLLWSLIPLQLSGVIWLTHAELLILVGQLSSAPIYDVANSLYL